MVDRWDRRTVGRTGGESFHRLAVLPFHRLPARLANPGDHSLEGQLAEADSAQSKPAEEGARTAAPATAVMNADLKLRLPLALLDHGLPSHRSLSS